MKSASAKATTSPTPAPTHVTVPLAFPVEVAGSPREALTMRFPTLNDLAWYHRLRGRETARVMMMVARLCDVPKDCLEELDHVDVVELLSACQNLMSEH